MHCTKKITEDITWVGASDRRATIFEGQYPIYDGMAYNSYLICDTKTVLVDTCDRSVAHTFFENVRAALDGRDLDYVIVQHMEPDHSATLEDLILRYPDVKLIVNSKTVNMIKQFFDFDIEPRAVVVNEGDTFSTGSHELRFIMAPMVHWPEVMMTYDTVSKILFSADAFGSFGAVDGSLFADSVKYDLYVDEARRYYANIVGKYGAQVQSVLKKCTPLEIEMLCPLHGLVWRKDLDLILDSYDRWSRYEPESQGLAVIYASVYGNSANVADILAGMVADEGKEVKVIDTNMKHHSYSVAAAFKYRNIVIITPTLDGGIMPKMEDTVLALAAHNLQNRRIAVIDNGTWAPVAGRKVTEMLAGLKNVVIFEEGLSVRSSLKSEGTELLRTLAKVICN